jgi:phage shock protein A
MKPDDPRGWRATEDAIKSGKHPPHKVKGHTTPERIKHLEHKVDHLESLIARQATDILELTMNAQDLANAVAELKTAVEHLPAPGPQLITQDELDEAVAGVTDATAALNARI